MAEFKKTGRAIIEYIEKGKLNIITIKRTKKIEGKKVEYYSIPGGHLEGDETFVEATKRELKEELNVEINIKEEILFLRNDDLKKDEMFYIAKIKSGNLSKGNGPEWENEDFEKYGKYEICLLDVKKISKYNLLPVQVKQILIDRYNKKS
ncbi:MAG: NUDIX domain-containing protein [Clostridia bacterium]